LTGLINEDKASGLKRSEGSFSVGAKDNPQFFAGYVEGKKGSGIRVEKEELRKVLGRGGGGRSFGTKKSRRRKSEGDPERMVVAPLGKGEEPSSG